MPKEISHCSSVPPCDRKDAMQSTSGSCPHACGLDGAVLGSWCLSAQHPACFFSCDWQQDVKIDHLPPGALGIQCMWVLLGCGRGVPCSGNRAGALKENATLEWGCLGAMRQAHSVGALSPSAASQWQVKGCETPEHHVPRAGAGCEDFPYFARLCLLLLTCLWAHCYVALSLNSSQFTEQCRHLDLCTAPGW